VNKNKLLLIISVLILILGGCAKKASYSSDEEDNTLKIYTYDSFVTWGLAEHTIPAFEEKYNCKVTLESVGDAGDLLNLLVLEKDNPQADVAIGVDNTMLRRALSEKLFVEYKSETLKSIPERLHFDKTYRLTPYDYGYFAFIYDSSIVDNVPTTFGQIQDGKWKNQIVISDPRTSTPGLGLLLWSAAAFGENGFGHFWRSIKNNILTVSTSWDEAYSMFLAGEVPIVLSYSTSPAFHIEYENTTRYKAFIPIEGAFMQIEGSGIVAGTRKLSLAQKFIDFTLTKEFQQHIPTTQWMYPVNDKVTLPDSFKNIPVPEKILNSNIKSLEDRNRIEVLIDRWVEIMSK